MEKENDTESQGLIAHKENYDIIINDENISFKTNNGESVDIGTDELLDIIVKNVKSKPYILALTNVDTKTIAVADVERTFYFTADNVDELTERIKNQVNETGQFTLNIKHPYPYNLMIIEEMYNIAKQSGSVVEVPLSLLEEAKENIDEKNKEFVKNFYQLEDEELKENNTK